jgi:hypothetical protein
MDPVSTCSACKKSSVECWRYTPRVEDFQCFRSHIHGLPGRHQAHIFVSVVPPVFALRPVKLAMRMSARTNERTNERMRFGGAAQSRLGCSFSSLRWNTGALKWVDTSIFWRGKFEHCYRAGQGCCAPMTCSSRVPLQSALKASCISSREVRLQHMQTERGSRLTFGPDSHTPRQPSPRTVRKLMPKTYPGSPREATFCEGPSANKAGAGV